MSSITIIGDVHGRHREYIKRVKDSARSICVGDVWASANQNDLRDLDPANHKIVGGNHDPYDDLTDHYLDDFGEVFGVGYIRGAWSVDYKGRVENISWWREEELSYPQMHLCCEWYKERKPKTLITHECPASIKETLISEVPRDRTSNFLEVLLRFHRPKLWIFGHHHQSLNLMVDGTRFICLNELETFQLEEDNYVVS